MATATLESDDRPLTAERPRVLLAAAPRGLRDRLRQSMATHFELREEADEEGGWQALLTDPMIRAVVAPSSLRDRLNASKIGRVQRMPLLALDAGAGVPILTGAAHPSDAEQRAMLDALTRILLDAQTRLRQGAAGADREPPRTLAAALQLARPPADAVNDQVQTTVADAQPQHNPSKKEPPMSRVENLNKVLKKLQSETQGIEASALISEDGLMIASALPQDMDETRIGGMSATLLNLGTRAATELRRGEVQEVIVRGEAGSAVMISAGRGTMLLVLATHSTPLGLIFFDMREALKSISNIL